MNEIMQKAVFYIAIFLILFGVYHFCWDFYVFLYRMYYDSNYFTQMTNSMKEFTAKWFPL